MVKYFKALAIAMMVGALAVVGLTLSANATHVTPVLVSGNPSCEGLKIEPVESGEFGPINLTVTGSSVSFTVDPGFLVFEVIVKGGPNANVYTYPGGTTADTGLTAPINPNTGRPFGLSHICFEFEGEPEPPKTTTPPPTTEPPK